MYRKFNFNLLRKFPNVSCDKKHVFSENKFAGKRKTLMNSKKCFIKVEWDKVKKVQEKIFHFSLRNFQPKIFANEKKRDEMKPKISENFHRNLIFPPRLNWTIESFSRNFFGSISNWKLDTEENGKYETRTFFQQLFLLHALSSDVIKNRKIRRT